MEANQRNKLTGAAIIVMSSMIISRITGFLRTVLITNLLDVKDSDAIIAAFTTTDFMYYLLVGGSISAALIPILSGYLTNNDEENGWKVIGSFINAVFIIMIIICSIGIFLAPQIVELTAKGLESEVKTMAISLTRILFPSVAFMMLAGMTNGVLNAYKRFAAAAYGPSIYNLGSVLSILLLSKYGIKAITFGIMLSALVYFVIQFAFSFKHFKNYRLKIHFNNPGFIRLVKLSIPSLCASSITQLNLIISTRFISNFITGSVTAYKNASDLWQMPYGIFATGLGTALLPTLAEKLALKEYDSFKNILTKGIRTVIYLIIPSGIGFIVLSEPIISVIYKWSGNIEPDRITNTGRILIFFSLALFSQSLIAIINRAFYADNDTKTPLYAGAVSILLNTLLCYIFFTKTSLELSGMSLAYSLQSFFNLIILTVIINKRIKGLDLKKIFIYIVKVLFASLVMGLILILMNKLNPMDFKAIFTIKSKIIEMLALIIEVGIGFSVYFAFTLAIKVDEANNIKNIICERVGKIRKKLVK